jgi:hypothetical protein
MWMLTRGSYRLLIAKEDLIAANHELVKTGEIKPSFLLVMAPKHKIVAYACRRSELFNVASFVCKCRSWPLLFADADACAVDTDLSEPVTSESWNAKGDVEALVRSIDDFAPIWKNLMRCATCASCEDVAHGRRC